MFYLKNFRSERDNFLKEFFNSDSKNILKTDVKEEDKSYILSIEIPGIKKEDINLEFEDGYLTISASCKEEITKESDRYIHQERNYGTFTRRFYIGNVNEKEVTAQSSNGILTIEIPKNTIENEAKKAINIDWK